MPDFGDALEFLRVAKFALRDNPYRYQELIHLLKDVRAGRIGTVGVVHAVQQMFLDDRPEIIFFLNVFLPERHKIRLSSPLVDEAKDLILKVKELSGDVDEPGGIYGSFLDLLGMYSRGMKPQDEVRREIMALFRDHQDLQHDFESFFPSSEGDQQPSAAAPTSPAAAGEGGSNTSDNNGEHPAGSPA